MRFTTSALIALALTASVAGAQSQPPSSGRGGSQQPPATGRQSQPSGPRGSAPNSPQLPRTVAPPIVYPLPPLATLPAGGLTPSGADNRAYRPGGPRQHPYPSSGYTPYGFGYGYDDASMPVPQTSSAPLPRPNGRLRLEVTPTSALVFVDGFYVGSVADVNASRDLAVPAGPHRVEIRAPLYQPVMVDVQVAPNETVTYRETMEMIRPTAPAPSARAAAAGNDKIYVISNCYIGNVPPRAGRLPSGCDAKQVRVLDRK